MTKDKINKVKSFENEDPLTYDELSNKKKWSFISKNSSKAIKD